MDAFRPAIAELPNLTNEAVTQILCGDSDVDTHAFSEFCLNVVNVNHFAMFARAVLAAKIPEPLADELVVFFHEKAARGEWNAFLLVLSTFIENAGENAYTAGAVYLRLLELATSRSYSTDVFHPIFYRKVLNLLMLRDKGGVPEEGPAKRKKGARGARKELEDSPAQAGASTLLARLAPVLRLFSFRPYSDALAHTLDALAASVEISSGAATLASEAAWCLLSSGLHGYVQTLAPHLMHGLLPALTATTGGLVGAQLSKRAQRAQQDALRLVTDLVGRALEGNQKMVGASPPGGTVADGTFAEPPPRRGGAAAAAKPKRGAAPKARKAPAKGGRKKATKRKTGDDDEDEGQGGSGDEDEEPAAGPKSRKVKGPAKRKGPAARAEASDDDEAGGEEPEEEEEESPDAAATGGDDGDALALVLDPLPLDPPPLDDAGAPLGPFARTICDGAAVLCERVCLRAPAFSDHRAAAVGVAIRLAGVLPPAYGPYLGAFLGDLVQEKKPALRTLATELLAQYMPVLLDKCPPASLLAAAGGAAPVGPDPNEAALKRLLGRLLGRMSDRSAVVRARALSCLGAILEGAYRGRGTFLVETEQPARLDGNDRRVAIAPGPAVRSGGMCPSPARLHLLLGAGWLWLRGAGSGALELVTVGDEEAAGPDASADEGDTAPPARVAAAARAVPRGRAAASRARAGGATVRGSHGLSSRQMALALRRAALELLAANEGALRLVLRRRLGDSHALVRRYALGALEALATRAGQLTAAAAGGGPGPAVSPERAPASPPAAPRGPSGADAVADPEDDDEPEAAAGAAEAAALPGTPTSPAGGAAARWMRLQPEEEQAIADRCLDPASSVRKQVGPPRACPQPMLGDPGAPSAPLETPHLILGRASLTLHPSLLAPLPPLLWHTSAQAIATLSVLLACSSRHRPAPGGAPQDAGGPLSSPARPQAARAEASPYERVARLWAQAVLPLVVDPEQSVAERALESVRQGIIEPFATRAASRGLTEYRDACLALHNLPTDVANHLRRALHMLAAQGRATPAALGNLCRYLKAGLPLGPDAAPPPRLQGPAPPPRPPPRAPKAPTCCRHGWTRAPGCCWRASHRSPTSSATSTPAWRTLAALTTTPGRPAPCGLPLNAVVALEATALTVVGHMGLHMPRPGLAAVTETLAGAAAGPPGVSFRHASDVAWRGRGRGRAARVREATLPAPLCRPCLYALGRLMEAAHHPAAAPGGAKVKAKPSEAEAARAAHPPELVAFCGEALGRIDEMLWRALCGELATPAAAPPPTPSQAAEALPPGGAGQKHGRQLAEGGLVQAPLFAHGALVALMGRRLELAGELSLIPRVALPPRLVTTVQALIAPTITPFRAAPPTPAAPAAPAPALAGAESQASPQPQTLQGHGHAVPAASAPVKVPALVRAHACTALGKMCVLNRSLAQRCLGIFVRELHCPEDALRMNALMVLCELCSHHTALADRYVPQLAARLQDEAPLIRHAALSLLAGLIQEDFVKWRGPVLFHMLAALADEAPFVRDLAEHCLVAILLRKSPQLLSNHFLDCIYVFNAHHPLAASSGPAIGPPWRTTSPRGLTPGPRAARPGPWDPQGRQEGRHGKEGDPSRAPSSFGTLPLGTAGPQNAHKRMAAYQALLRHMADDQKVNTMGKLTQNAASRRCGHPAAPRRAHREGRALDPGLAAIGVFTWALRPRAGSAAALAAHRKLLGQMVKKHMAENVLPVFIELKHILQARRSPLFRDLMAALQELLRDYHDQIQDLITDRQLATELTYDMRVSATPRPTPMAPLGGVATPGPGKPAAATPGAGQPAPAGGAPTPAPGTVIATPAPAPAAPQTPAEMRSALMRSPAPRLSRRLRAASLPPNSTPGSARPAPLTMSLPGASPPSASRAQLPAAAPIATPASASPAPVLRMSRMAVGRPDQQQQQPQQQQQQDQEQEQSTDGAAAMQVEGEGEGEGPASVTSTPPPPPPTSRLRRRTAPASTPVPRGAGAPTSSGRPRVVLNDDDDDDGGWPDSPPARKAAARGGKVKAGTEASPGSSATSSSDDDDSAEGDEGDSSAGSGQEEGEEDAGGETGHEDTNDGEEEEEEEDVASKPPHRQPKAQSGMSRASTPPRRRGGVICLPSPDQPPPQRQWNVSPAAEKPVYAGFPEAISSVEFILSSPIPILAAFFFFFFYISPNAIPTLYTAILSWWWFACRCLCSQGDSVPAPCAAVMQQSDPRKRIRVDPGASSSPPPSDADILLKIAELERAQTQLRQEIVPQLRDLIDLEGDTAIEIHGHDERFISLEERMGKQLAQSQAKITALEQKNAEVCLIFVAARRWTQYRLQIEASNAQLRNEVSALSERLTQALSALEQRIAANLSTFAQRLAQSSSLVETVQRQSEDSSKQAQQQAAQLAAAQSSLAALGRDVTDLRGAMRSMPQPPQQQLQQLQQQQQQQQPPQQQSPPPQTPQSSAPSTSPGKFSPGQMLPSYQLTPNFSAGRSGGVGALGPSPLVPAPSPSGPLHHPPAPSLAPAFPDLGPLYVAAWVWGTGRAGGCFVGVLCDLPDARQLGLSFLSKDKAIGWGLHSADGSLYSADRELVRGSRRLATGDRIRMLVDLERGDLLFWINEDDVGAEPCAQLTRMADIRRGVYPVLVMAGQAEFEIIRIRWSP
ncbi:putative non-SMC condensin II complex subunit D3 L homeolog [Paratrimastix pyriformis]|uniref:Non-SMC condensin II complex subunit D3 L homeolog n=1 Tax=Paratrimastix pyriformis TaxID=342808 RepID=A0ABQ8V0W3_9EUKA|nr:putative non-SMC condensin II complex subunit D3 L homeolog [Paratrimastix pyriformis]